MEVTTDGALIEDVGKSKYLPTRASAAVADAVNEAVADVGAGAGIGAVAGESRTQFANILRANGSKSNARARIRSAARTLKPELRLCVATVERDINHGEFRL